MNSPVGPASQSSTQMFSYVIGYVSLVTEMVPNDVQEELKHLYTAAGELLRHFWSCFPVNTPFLEEKVTIAWRGQSAVQTITNLPTPTTVLINSWGILLEKCNHSLKSIDHPSTATLSLQSRGLSVQRTPSTASVCGPQTDQNVACIGQKINSNIRNLQIH